MRIDFGWSRVRTLPFSRAWPTNHVNRVRCWWRRGTSRCSYPNCSGGRIGSGQSICGSPTYPSSERDRALVSRRCHSARAYAGTGLSAQGFTVPSRNLV